MSFNASKCNSITITRKKKKIEFPYHLHGQKLEHVNSTTYLGVELPSDLSWKPHIQKTCKKANKSLSFLRRNLKISNPEIKETAYKGLVRPITEYSCSVWDPHQKTHIDSLEMVQRRAARFVLNRYHNTSSVTKMLQFLEWESLQARRTRARLTIFYKILHDQIAITLPRCALSPVRQRPGYPHAFQTVFASTNAYKCSFFPKTINQWNLLPATIAESDTAQAFQQGLATLPF
jgi:hypothetical protein